MNRRTMMLAATAIVVGAAVAVADPPLAEANGALWDALRGGGHVVLMRHSLAPGSGDPRNFDLADCTTQRNLDERGRAQATAAGERFRRENVAVDAVYSSRWCRCLETAERLDLGPVQPLDALNSQMNLGPSQAEALAASIATRGPGRPTAIYVTHSSNIRGLLRTRASSGEAIVARVGDDGTLAVVGSLGVVR